MIRNLFFKLGCTHLTWDFYRDTDAIDVMPMYSELAKDSDFAVAHTANNIGDEAPGTSRDRARVSKIIYL